jgi:flagellar assembly factor FliW
MTANLRAPVVVKFSEKSGKQIILTEERFSLNHRIFQTAPAEGPQKKS